VAEVGSALITQGGQAYCGAPVLQTKAVPVSGDSLFNQPDEISKRFYLFIVASLKALPSALKLGSQQSFLCILNHVIDTRMHAEKAIPKGQRMGTVNGSPFCTFSKVSNSNLNNAAIFDALGGFFFCFRSLFRHDRSPLQITLQENFCRKLSKHSIG
jgi:hypothetical protein